MWRSPAFLLKFLRQCGHYIFEYPEVRSIKLGAFDVTFLLVLVLVKFSVAGLSSTSTLLLRLKVRYGEATSLFESVDCTDALLFL